MTLHIVIQEMGRFPSEYMALPEWERAMITASFMKAQEDRDKLEKKYKK